MSDPKKMPFVNGVIYGKREFKMWVLTENGPPGSMAAATVYEHEPLTADDGKEPPDTVQKFFTALVTLMIPTQHGPQPLESEVPIQGATTLVEAFKLYEKTGEGFARELEEQARKPKLMLPPGVGAPNNPFGRRK